MSRPNVFRVTFIAFCGMDTAEGGAAATMDEARALAASILRSRRALGFKPTIRTRGVQWEVCEPDGAHMVPDEAGALTLFEPETADCDWCGTTCVPETIGRNAVAYCSECCRADAGGWNCDCDECSAQRDDDSRSCAMDDLESGALEAIDAEACERE